MEAFENLSVKKENQVKRVG